MALEVLCFYIISRTNMLQGNDVMSSANTVVGQVYKKREDFVYYFGLRRMNDSLLAENEKLRATLARATGLDTLGDTLVRKERVVMQDSTQIVQFADYVYREARVVNNSVTAENNYITINRGTKQGIQKKMAVISGTGVVGEVVHVSDNFASVLSVLNMKRKVSARLKDGTTGFVSWEVGSPDVLVLEDISKEVKVYKDDSVFTTSYSLFPEGVLIGTVWKRRINKKTNIQILYLKSATNFRNLQYVYVIEDKKMPERLKLEETAKQSK